VKFKVQKPNPVTLEGIPPSPTPYQHITEGPYTAVCFFNPVCPAELSRKLQGTAKAKNHFEKIDQASELDSDMAGMLQLSGWEFKTTVANILRALMDKVDSIQEQKGSLRRETEIETSKKQW
jgi:hypothetical protein